MTLDSTDNLIFLHIPKTGGSTLRDILRRQYPKSAIYVPHLRAGDANRRYLDFLRQGGKRPEPRNEDRNKRHVRAIEAFSPQRRAGLRLYMGHFWFGLHQALEVDARYITLLRDPVDRVLSLYQHRVTNHDLTQSVEEYVEIGRDFEMDNGQTRRLSGSTGEVRSGPCTPEMRARAAANLRQHFSVVGLTERFDESVLAMRGVFGWRNVHYFRRNVGSDRPRREQLSRTALRIIEDHNRFDLEMYDLAERLLEDRLEEHGVGRTLRRFRRTNEVYRRVSPLFTRGADRGRQLGGRVRRLAGGPEVPAQGRRR